MPSPTRRTCATTLLLACASMPALAGQFDYTLFGGVEHSDNINLSATDPVSQSVLVPGFGFSYQQQGSALQANVIGAGEYRHYMGSAYSDQKVGELAGMLNWSAVPGRLDFVLQDRASVQPLSTLASDAPGNQQQTNVFALGPTVHFLLGSATRGQVDLRYINSRASRTTQFDSSRGEAALRIIRDISPTSQLSFNVDTQKVHFDESDEINYRRDEAFVRYAHRLTHLSLDFAGGWARIRSDASQGLPSRTYSDPMARVSATWQVNPRNSLGGSYTHSYSDAAQDLISMVAPADYGARPDTPNATPTGIQTGGAVIGSGVYLERRAEATYSYSGTRLTVSISPYYRKLHYITGFQPDQEGRGGNAGLDYLLPKRLTLSAFANYERVRYQVLDRRDSTRNLGIGLRQQLNDHWSWRSTLTDRHRGSTDPIGRYHAKEIYLGVVYQR